MDSRKVKSLVKAATAAANEIERLRFLYLPHYEGKIGEPNLKILNRLRKSLQKVEEQK